MSITRHQAKPEDAFELQLREEDAAEVSGDWRVLVAGTILVHGGWSYRAPDGRLLGIYGRTVIDHWRVSPWLLCDDIPESLRLALLREARYWVRNLQRAADRGALVSNRVPRHSASNRRFLRSLGFRIVREPGSPGPDTFYLPPHV